MKKINELTVLVVDDDSDLLEATVYILELFGLKVQNAKDGLEAWNKLQSQNFDIVLSDVRMPNLDGVALLNNIRTHLNREIVVFLTSGYHDTNTRTLFSMGVDGFFEKPVSPHVLRTAIQRSIISTNQRWSTAPEKVQAKIENSYKTLQDFFHNSEFRIGREGFSTHLTNQTLKVGDYIEFNFKIDELVDVTIAGAAQVRWKDEFNIYGCTFEFISDASRKIFCQHLKNKDFKSTIPA